MKPIPALAFAISSLLLPSCMPVADAGKFMRVVTELPSAPPPGKSMLVIHRPWRRMGAPLYFGVWDGHRLVANLGNGHTVAYVCEPGRHSLIGRSAEIKTVVEVDMLPDQTYDLATRNGGLWIVSFHLVPAGKDDADLWQDIEYAPEVRRVVALQDDCPELREYEAAYQKKLDVILREAAQGDVKRIHVDASSHR